MKIKEGVNALRILAENDEKFPSLLGTVGFIVVGFFVGGVGLTVGGLGLTVGGLGLTVGGLGLTVGGLGLTVGGLGQSPQLLLQFTLMYCGLVRQ